MKVEHVIPVEAGHSIELGAATWNDQHRSVRNRFATANGGFSNSRSSEVPEDDVIRMVMAMAEHDWLSAEDIGTMIKAMGESLIRQSVKPVKAVAA